MTREGIQLQVKLPLSVAGEVVMQGIRIRLGRSIVTLTGVVLGIAFLASILASQSIRASVAEEEQLRQSVDRMMNFLTAETGPVEGRTFAAIITGELAEPERRLLRRIEQGGAAELRAWSAEGAALAPGVGDVVKATSPEQLAGGAHAVLLMGGGPLPPWEISAAMSASRNNLLAVSADRAAPQLGQGRTVLLHRQLRPEELARREKQRRAAHFRRNWIVIISLVVTVACISNSMLMSVTERFREIGTMKCLGALSSFIRRIFLIESTLLGFTGSLVGALLGVVFAAVAHAITYGPSLVFGSLPVGPMVLQLLLCTLAGVVLSVLAALYPAQVASRMVPAHALRTNV